MKSALQYEQLRDDNIQLKTSHKKLQEQIKVIAVKLKRQVEQLKDNRKGKVFDEKAFDLLVEESVRLQAEEKSLTEKIKSAKHVVLPADPNKDE